MEGKETPIPGRGVVISTLGLVVGIVGIIVASILFSLAKDEKAQPWTLMRKLSAQVREMLTDKQKKTMGASPRLRTLQKLGAPADAPQNPTKARTEEEAKAQVINVWGGAGGSVIVVDEAKEGTNEE